MRALTTLALCVSALGLLCLSACTGPKDDPTNVHDLRILAMRSEPPEVTIGACPQIDPNADQAAIQAALAQLAGQFAATAPTYQLTALVADPQGAGRTLEYDWIACPDTPDGADVICTDQPSYVVVGGTQAPAGTPSMTFAPTIDFVSAAAQMYSALALFGIRFMVTLQVKTLDGSEVITGGKRITLSCQLVPGQTTATNPAFTTISLDGQTWDAGSDPTLAASQVHTVAPADPTPFEQQYVVPLYTGGSEQLTEAWMYTYMATAGGFDSLDRGGVALTGQTEPINDTWTAHSTDPEQDVTFYFILRNGRGGETWTTRQGHLSPGQ